MALCRYIVQGNCNQRKVEEHWHRVFCCVAKYLGFNKATRKILWEELVAGNWKKLHTTDEECRRTPDEWLEKLESDVWYCSDRYTLDRLTRCHWLYRQYMQAVQKYGVTDYAIRI
jgi:hypothetical protein